MNLFARRTIASLSAIRSCSARCSAITAASGCQRRQFSRKPATSELARDFAFAFDIDGVLIRGAKALEEGKEALHLLKEHNIPWILLTNGGGKSESERVAGLSSQLGIDIHIDQFVQSHTPFKRLVHRYNKVLVVGGDRDKCRHVAEAYGFKDCAMSVDVLAANKNIWPFNRFTPEDLALARPLTESKFDAVLVFNDPRDWGCDTQVIVDVLASDEGVYGTRSSGLKQTVPIYFSNDDLLWANEYSLPRFGQGAFRRGIETIFREYTGSEMQSTIIGKPYLFTYEYAHSVLNDWRRHAFGYTHDVHRVYMVGDNPASDIRGGNSYGWSTLLVRSGVYKDGDVLDSRSKPTAVVDNVLAAVMQAIEFEQEHRLQK